MSIYGLVWFIKLLLVKHGAPRSVNEALTPNSPFIAEVIKMTFFEVVFTFWLQIPSLYVQNIPWTELASARPLARVYILN